VRKNSPSVHQHGGLPGAPPFREQVHERADPRGRDTRNGSGQGIEEVPLGRRDRRFRKISQLQRSSIVGEVKGNIARHWEGPFLFPAAPYWASSLNFL